MLSPAKIVELRLASVSIDGLSIEPRCLRCLKLTALDHSVSVKLLSRFDVRGMCPIADKCDCTEDPLSLYPNKSNILNFALYVDIF